MIMDYWSERRLNHHTESATMLYGARECARITLQEGLAKRFARHALASSAMVAGLSAMGLDLFGDLSNKMTNVTGIEIPTGIDGEKLRGLMRDDFQIEIGSSFGPLRGRIWRIGAMGYNCQKHHVLTTLCALETSLRKMGRAVPSGLAADAALKIYDAGQA
jgi:(S)-ureidoglycine-glyoxylate aminotransferase